MASQIAAQLALGLQVPVVMRDLDTATAAEGLAAARDVVAQTAARGTLDEAAAAQIAEDLSATTDLQELAGCDLVHEAVPEVLSIQRSVFAEPAGVLAEDALLVTNTASLSVAAMAEGLTHPERVVGLHFFNPVAKMPLVEVVHTEATDEATLATGLEVVRRLRKFAVRSADAPDSSSTGCCSECSERSSPPSTPARTRRRSTPRSTPSACRCAPSPCWTSWASPSRTTWARCSRTSSATASTPRRA